MYGQAEGTQVDCSITWRTTYNQSVRFDTHLSLASLVATSNNQCVFLAGAAPGEHNGSAGGVPLSVLMVESRQNVFPASHGTNQDSFVINP